MMHLEKVAAIAAGIATVAATAYYFLCILSALIFLRRRRQPPRAPALDTGLLPQVSILKPLKGIDPEIYESFRSHCQQDYPQYEIIFGVDDPTDPALPLVERLRLEFPARPIQVVYCDEDLGANTKVSNLIQMLRVARYEHLVVNDSDIRVEADYLRRIMAPLRDPEVGMVTCLYRGKPAPTLGSRLESLGISTDFAGGVLSAQYLEGGLRFGLGSTLAFRRHDLQTIGGFQSFVDYLADDYQIGARFAARGWKVRLSEVVVETFLPAYRFREFVSHQLRWARSVRGSRPWGYAGLLLTFGLPWALLTVVCARGALWAWTLFAVVLTLRLFMAMIVGTWVLGDRQVPRGLWLIPLRDLIAVAVWMASFAGRTVAWRGDSFHLKNGKLARIGP